MHPFNEINFNQAHLWVIEASAGTGKTWTIERLYVKALLQNIEYKLYTELSIKNILVVTFTEAATKELKARIRMQIYNTINLIIQINNSELDLSTNDIYINYLVSRYQNDNLDYRQDILFLNLALQGFDNAAIYTIHGFCNQVLKSYPFECGVNPDYGVLTDNKKIIIKLVNEFVLNIFSYDKYLKYAINIEENLNKIFAPNNVFNLDYENDSLENRIINAIPRDLIIYQDNSYKIKYPYEDIEIDKVLSLLTDDITSENIIELKIKCLSLCFKYIISNYDKYLGIENKITNDDLIQLVANAINNESLACKIYQQYPIAFIDEFQDTDQLQWTIFSNIYQANQLSRGNMVIVGDPKQAIYKFRGADINTYITARHEINHVCQLVDNYRSSEAIMNFINTLFNLTYQKSSITDSYLGNNIDYICINPRGENNLLIPKASQIQETLNNQGVYINREYFDEDVQVITINGKTADLRLKDTLNHIASEILGLLAVDPMLINKIAIIVDSYAQISEISKYLKRFNLKVSEPRLGNIFSTSTAIDVYNILLSINDLTNRKKFTKALASKIFNFPLYQLNNDSGIKDKFAELFIKYSELWKNEGVVSLFYHMAADIFSYHDDSIVMSNRELANFWQLSELISRVNTNNNEELLYWFKKKIDNAINNKYSLEELSEEIIRLDNDTDHITITTIHKSKGLEYDILFCPFFRKTAKELKSLPVFTSLDSKPVIIKENKTQQAIQYLKEENQEIQRLNYVALTRAKSRLYIYLKGVTKTRGGGYFQNSSPESINELFGFNFNNPNDNSHPLFNYEDLFSSNPIKEGSPIASLSGLKIYSVDDLEISSFKKLKINYKFISQDKLYTNAVNLTDKSFKPDYYKQSYTELTHSNNLLPEFSDKDLDNIESFSFKEISYKYSILNDPELKGAVFGILFHQLCEDYPFNDEKLHNILISYNINNEEYITETQKMMSDVFNYPIINNASLNMIDKKIHELEFNISIKNNIDIKNELSLLIGDYFGSQHPFTQSIKTLDTINYGFLVGFIDLTFEYNGKYYILDYKTNKIDDYTYTYYDENTCMTYSMAENHYYLQYLLYLVALKRYLEYRLRINDATELIGGAVYYYVRGALTSDINKNDGIYIDDRCQNLIQQMDSLLKGIVDVK